MRELDDMEEVWKAQLYSDTTQFIGILPRDVVNNTHESRRERN